ncbi:MAG: hypothetical protein JWP94_2980 [Mucilaginibacter sp.]|nr:hypothetical protein [Mucilaginibacter sp.]
MTEEEVNKIEKIQGQIQGLHVEIGTLSKKNPDGALNKFKLKFINQILVNANELLIGQYKPLDGFEKFDDDDLPTNSDVTIILEQYLTCLEKLRSDNITSDHGYWYWRIAGKTSSIRTIKPQKLNEK